MATKFTHDAQHKFASGIVSAQPDISVSHVQKRTSHARKQAKSTQLKPTGAEHESRRHGRRKVHTQPHTHLQVPTSGCSFFFSFFFLKAAGKLPPLNVLSVVVVAVSEGGKDTLPPTGQASSCHVQQMHPKLSRRTTTAE